MSGVGLSEPSASTFVDVPELLPPEAPESFNAALSPDNEAFLSWTSPNPAPERAPVTCYKVYLEAANGQISELGTTLSLSYRHGGLTVGTRYVYHVRAMSAAGSSEPSASAFVDVPELMAPEAPGTPNAHLTPTREALLTWLAPAPSPARAPVTGYQVYLESAGGLASPLGSEIRSLSYRHDDLRPGRTYVYHVVALSDSGPSLPSDSVFVDVPGIPIFQLAEPRLTVRADEGDGVAVISWVHRLNPELSVEVDGFELQYCRVSPTHQTDRCLYEWTTVDLNGDETLNPTTRAYTDTFDCDRSISRNPQARMCRIKAIASEESASSRFSEPTHPICPGGSEYFPPPPPPPPRSGPVCASSYPKQGKHLLGRTPGQPR